jgi:hypothetical protein
MRLPRVRFSIRRMMIGMAFLTILLAWGIDQAKRSRLRFDFYDYRVVNDEPLVNPTEFFGIEGNRVALGGRRLLEVEATTWTYSDDPPSPWTRPADLEHLSWGLRDQLGRMKSDGRPGIVDLQATPDGRTQLFVRNQPWYCGTGLGPLIRIPLFRRTVYRNRRLLIGIGTLKEHSRPASPRP